MIDDPERRRMADLIQANLAKLAAPYLRQKSDGKTRGAIEELLKGAIDGIADAGYVPLQEGVDYRIEWADGGGRVRIVALSARGQALLATLARDR